MKKNILFKFNKTFTIVKTNHEYDAKNWKIISYIEANDPEQAASLFKKRFFPEAVKFVYAAGDDEFLIIDSYYFDHFFGCNLPKIVDSYYVWEGKWKKKNFLQKFFSSFFIAGLHLQKWKYFKIEK